MNGNALLSGNALAAWRVAQGAVWLVGVAIVVALVVAPSVGITAVWNVLIPVAPALLVFAPGLWRNLCPLATTALFARHVGLSAGVRVSPAAQERLNAIGLAALLLVVPLRHDEAVIGKAVIRFWPLSKISLLR